MMHFLKRGSKFTIADTLRSLVIFAIFALLAWKQGTTLGEAYFFGFFLCTSLVIPPLTKSGFSQRRSNLASPFEFWLRRFERIQWVADVLLAVGLGVMLSQATYSSWFLAICTLVYMAYATIVLFSFWRANRLYRRWLSTFLCNYAAMFVLHTPRPDGGTYQVEMWLEPLESLGFDYLIVVRDARALNALRNLTKRPILVCAAWKDLDQVMTPNIRAVFYVNSVGANADLLTYRTAHHVYLGHGDSEKPLSVHPLHAAFDYIAVAGQAAIDRYLKAGFSLPENKFLRIGRPQRASTSEPDGALLGTRDMQTVIYAPTWFGYNSLSSYSSLTVGRELVERLVAAGYRVIFRPHPFSRHRAREREICHQIEQLLQTENASTGANHLYGPSVSRLTFSDVTPLGDALIADRSSVIVDFLSTGKPIAEMEFSEEALDTQRGGDLKYCYRIDRSLDNLESIVTLMFEEDPLSGTRAEAYEYYVTPSPDPADQFRNTLSFLFRNSAPAVDPLGTR